MIYLITLTRGMETLVSATHVVHRELDYREEAKHITITKNTSPITSLSLPTHPPNVLKASNIQI